MYYWEKLRFELTWDQAAAEAFQRSQFVSAGFDFERSLIRLNEILQESDLPDFEHQTGMGSIHWVLFCSLSLRYDIREILEIGTYDGQTAAILTSIFPESHVTTVDLPPDDPLVKAQAYDRPHPTTKPLSERRRINTQHPRIEYRTSNSFFLPELLDRQFDMIWIDGGHRFPEIAWDICNAYHLCKPGGWLMCDDVIQHPDGIADEYTSTESHGVLEYVSQRSGEPVRCFLKRTSAAWAANPRKRKSVALMRKPEAASL